MRRRSRLAVLLAAVLVLLAAAGYPVYVRPQVDELRKADAIVVLGGSHSGDRYRMGVELAHAGWAPTLLMSNPFAHKDKFVDKLCQTPQPRIDVECFAPDPRTTLGEGREIGRLAAERGWRTVIVVTSVTHISRARYIIEKCYDGALVMAASPTHMGPIGWAAMYIYQTAGYLKAFIQGPC